MWRRLRRPLGPDPARDVDDELAFHLEMRLRERIAAGEDAEAARAQVMRRLGDVQAARAECLDINERKDRRMKRSDYVHELKQDVTYALRSLRRRPMFAAVAVITLGLGIGANSAIFSVVNGVLLEPLPYTAPGQLVQVQTEYTNGTAFSLSAPDFMSLREDARVFSDIGGHSARTVTMTGRGEPREVQATGVTRELFSVLGIAPLAGRAFTPEEHIPGAGTVAILSEGFARREFGDVADALNATVTLAGSPYSVIGVMPAGSETPAGTELYRPITYDSTFSAATSVARRSEYLTVIGRLQPRVSRETAERDVRRVAASLQERFPGSNETLTFRSTPLVEMIVGDVRTPLLVLLGAVALVLLIACANVANLLLARATAREGELAVRAALGAGRSRLIRQLLTESLVLAVAGAALGLVLAWLATRSLIAAQPADIPRLDHISMSSTVVAFTAIIALLTGILFGTLPALQVTGAGMTQSLRESGRGAQSGVRGARVRGALVVSELALAIVLLFGAGLLIRSFLQMTRVDTGFRTENALTFRVSLQGTTYDEPARREQFFARLEERLLALPGVTAVGAATGLPMTGQGSILGPFSVEGQEVPPDVLPEIRLQTVTPGYFETLGAPLLMGRALDVRDRSDAPLVALFNRAAIARWFPDGNPVGQRVLLGGTPFQVVGIVADVMQRAPGRPIEPEMYIPHAQDQTRTLRYVVRGTGDMAAVAARIPREVHALDGDIPVETVNALSSLFTDAVARPRLYTTLLTLFAAIALALAVIGIFGVVSYLVAQRSREISIRMALGANARNVVGMIVGGAMKIAGAGLLVGLGAALVGARVLQSQLFGVRVVDPTTLVAAVALLGAAAAVASLIPALRAARSDPGAVLRDGA